MNIEDLTPAQKEKLLACKTSEELLALAKEEGFELTDKDLEGVAGGGGWSGGSGIMNCPDVCC